MLLNRKQDWCKNNNKSNSGSWVWRWCDKIVINLVCVIWWHLNDCSVPCSDGRPGVCCCVYLRNLAHTERDGALVGELWAAHKRPAGLADLGHGSPIILGLHHSAPWPSGRAVLARHGRERHWLPVGDCASSRAIRGGLVGWKISILLSSIWSLTAETGLVCLSLLPYNDQRKAVDSISGLIVNDFALSGESASLISSVMCPSSGPSCLFVNYCWQTAKMWHFLTCTVCIKLHTCNFIQSTDCVHTASPTFDI